MSPGGTIDLSGDGFEGNETIPIVLYSAPVVLGQPSADDDGALAARVTIPADTASGTHTLVAYGSDRILTVTFDVVAGASGDDDGRDTTTAPTPSRVDAGLGGTADDGATRSGLIWTALLLVVAALAGGVAVRRRATVRTPTPR